MQWKVPVIILKKYNRKIKARTCTNGSTQHNYTDCKKSSKFYSNDGITPGLPQSSMLIKERTSWQLIYQTWLCKNRYQQKPNGKKYNENLRDTSEHAGWHLFSQLLGFVGYGRTQKVFYVDMKKALYRLLQSSLLHYKNLGRTSTKLDL